MFTNNLLVSTSLKVVSIIPALPPPTADAYDKAKSFALPELSLWTAIKQGTPPPF